MNLICKNCGEEITLNNVAPIGKYTLINGSGIKRCCANCAKQIEDKLKKQYFIETYNDNDIYCKDGKYAPYWGCKYYFKSLEDCEKRIDNKTYAMINMGDFYTLNSLTNDDK